MRPASFRAGVLAVVVALSGGCTAGLSEEGSIGTLTVLAAASLADSFGRIARDFEATRPGLTVYLSFAGSSQLAQQIVAGAPADVFAAANPATMRVVTGTFGTAGQPQTFARNRLVIAVPRGNPAGVDELADLARPGLRVALCAPQVPCGAAARIVLERSGTRFEPVTLEGDVRAVLTKVELGEVDAALVYRTEVRSGHDVVGIEFAESGAAVNDYLILALPDAANPTVAAEFVGYVRSDRARTVLAGAGFQLP